MRSDLHARHADLPLTPLLRDRPGRMMFGGVPEARLFARQVEASLAGVLRTNYLLDDPRGPSGLVTASVGGRPCHDHVWTRDCGVFIRELAHNGCHEHALLACRRLIELAAPGDEGSIAFPQHYHLGQGPASGSEIDGTAAIVIACALLWQRLPRAHAGRAELADFLHRSDSPVEFLRRGAERGLLAGSGEFGGGLGVEGRFCNVVQNHLAAAALRAAAAVAREAGDAAGAQRLESAAARLEELLLRHLVGPDGAWLWCVAASTLQPDPAVLAAPANRGFGGINGVLAMRADVAGFDAASWPVLAPSLRTLDALLAEPQRRSQFERFGMWSQFDAERAGLLTSPSYGQGYAIQCLLLADRLEEAGRALAYLATATAEPPPFLVLDRASRDHFYERYYAPDAAERCVTDEGCGALNLVNVAEPLKCARLILGIDDRDPALLRIAPRLPPGWDEAVAEDWPVRADDGTRRVHVRIARAAGRTEVAVESADDRPLPRVAVRVRAEGGWTWAERAPARRIGIVC